MYHLITSVASAAQIEGWHLLMIRITPIHIAGTINPEYNLKNSQVSPVRLRR
jgi:hypothetical protein